MKGAENVGGIAAFVFHYIYLARGGPTAINGIFGHQPQSRPVSLSLGQPGAKFKPAIFLVEQTAGFELGGGVAGAIIGFLQSRDVQQAVGDINILRTAGIIFQFIIAPTGVRRPGADVKSPMAGVERRAVELIAPYKLPASVVQRIEPNPDCQKREGRGGVGRSLIPHSASPFDVRKLTCLTCGGAALIGAS